MGSNYAPTIHVQKEAANKGLQQVLWLYGPDHQLTEVGTMNIFVLLTNEKGGSYSNDQNDLECIWVAHDLTLFVPSVSERELVTPPLNGLILPGITRDSILHLTKQWGYCKVSERNITMDEVCKLIKEERVSSHSHIPKILSKFEPISNGTFFKLLAPWNVRNGHSVCGQPNWTDSVFGNRFACANNGTRETIICSHSEHIDGHSIWKNWTSMGRCNRLTWQFNIKYLFYVMSVLFLCIQPIVGL